MTAVMRLYPPTAHLFCREEIIRLCLKFWQFFAFVEFG